MLSVCAIYYVISCTQENCNQRGFNKTFVELNKCRLKTKKNRRFNLVTLFRPSLTTLFLLAAVTMTAKF